MSPRSRLAPVRPLALALLCWACAEPDAAPVLTRCAPERVPKSSLPMPGSVEGERLFPSLTIQLDDGSSAATWPVLARLGSVELKDVKTSDGTKVQFTVPAQLSAGAYDFELELGPGRSARLARALTIMADGIDPPVVIPADGGPPDQVPPDQVPPDEPVQYPTYLNCAQFSAPTPVTVLGMAQRSLWSPALSTDAQTLYLGVTGTTGDELWTATRADRESVFSGALALPDLAGGGDNGTPFPSADGLSLYFTAAPPGAASASMEGRDLYRATRAARSLPFGNAQPLTELNSSDRDQLPWVSRDELIIVFESERSGTARLYTASRSSRTSPFSAPVLLPGVAGGSDNRPFLTPDGLGLLLSSDRPGTVGAHDLWIASRPMATAPFPPLRNLSVLNTTSAELDVTVTQDGTELFFVVRDQSDNNQLFRALAACP